jgi:6-phosphofructokinase 1
MVRTLADLKVDILFVIGGDGTLQGAPKIAEEANRQGMALKRHWHPEDHRQ